MAKNKKSLHPKIYNRFYPSLLLRDAISYEGGLGSLEAFSESVPQTFIQTGFFVLGESIKIEFALLQTRLF